MSAPERPVVARAHAKVNLHLGVGRPRGDGFHSLVTVFHAVDLHDDVTLSPGPGRITVTGRDGIDAGGVPLDAGNIAARALAALGCSGADVHIDKGIPVAGGMAGGSADAAAALVALAAGGGAVAGAGLHEAAAALGSDVPFALLGGTAVGRGRGELLEPVEHVGRLHWVVLPDSGGLSTPEVYRRYDELRPDAPAVPDEPTALLAALAAGDVEGLARALHNDLEVAALDLRPDLARTLAAGEAAGALRGIVSGSGPTCVLLCADAEHGREVAAALRPDRPALVAAGPAPGAHLPEDGRG